MQTIERHQPINYIKVVVNSTNFYNVIRLLKSKKKKSIPYKLCDGMIVLSDMNEFTISTIHKSQQVISVMGSVHYAKVFHLDKRNCNI
jgi:hypothetical protein